MPIKKASTGIFEKETIWNLTRAEQRLLRNRALNRWDLDGRLERLGAWAKKILKNAGMGWLPNGIESKISEAEWQEKPELGDAWLILTYIGVLRDAMKEGKIEKAICCALDLGELEVQAYVRPHEKPASIGRRVQRKTAENRDSEGLKLAKERKAEEYREWAECARQYRMRHRNPSGWEVARYVHRTLETVQKPDTIRRKLRKKTGKV
jgi:hypothetical protein